MNWQTKSPAGQGLRWGVTVLAALAGYVLLSYGFYGSWDWNPLAPRQQRLFVPVVALAGFVLWKTRRDGVVRSRSRLDGPVSSASQPADGKSSVRCAAAPVGSAVRRGGPAASVAAAPAKSTAPAAPVRAVVPAAAPPTPAVEDALPDPFPPAWPSAVEEGASGEELYAQARLLPHRFVPDFDADGAYLRLLGASAAKGYLEALAKLGEYAMRRSAWVEAYYWMWLARRGGKAACGAALREIRRAWAWAGYPDQRSNVYPLFSEEASSIGRALLGVDSGHNAHAARAYLEANHPAFLAAEG